MKVFASEDKIYGDFANPNIATAAHGFREFGIEVLKYKTLGDVRSNHQYGDIVLGGVGQVRQIYSEYGINTPDFDYPNELRAYYGREFWGSTLNTVYNNPDSWGIFIKPVEDKKFTGKVVRELKDFVGLGSAYEDIDIICSDVVDIKAEWRAFIRYDKILDIRPYRGDWHYNFNANLVDKALKAFTDWKDRPYGCSIDFGVTSRGHTIVVEVNDGYSLGCYGLQSVDYAKLISARSSQLWGVKDDLLTALEMGDWLDRKSEAMKENC